MDVLGEGREKRGEREGEEGRDERRRGRVKKGKEQKVVMIIACKEIMS